MDHTNELDYENSYLNNPKPKNLIFKDKLNDYAREVLYICLCAENNYSTSGLEAYEEIQKLWKNLEQTKQQLQIGQRFENELRDW